MIFETRQSSREDGERTGLVLASLALNSLWHLDSTVTGPGCAACLNVEPVVGWMARVSGCRALSGKETARVQLEVDARSQIVDTIYGRDRTHTRMRHRRRDQLQLQCDDSHMNIKNQQRW